MKADAPLLVGLVALVMVIYGATIAPSLTWHHVGADGGDFITAAATGRVPHPPGFPLYFLISRSLVILIPGDPARVLNWLSASMAAATSLCVVLTLRRRQASRWAAGIAGLTLALAPWFWSQALITEVYTTAAFFTSLALYFAEVMRSRETPDAWGGAPFIAGLTLGGAMAVHPLAGFAAFYVLPAAVGAGAAAFAGLALGLVPYALLPLAGPWPQPWGDLRTFEGWWRFVTARIYWGNAFALPLADWPRRLLAWPVLMVRQWSPLGVVLVGLGVAEMAQARPRRLVRWSLVLGMGTIYAIGYDTADSWVYLIPLLPFLALAVGLGLKWAMERGLPAAVALVVPLILLLNWTRMDIHNAHQATRWLEATLEQLPSAAVAVTEEDTHTFALWYATAARGWRDDVTVVDRRLLWFDPYRAYLGKQLNVAERDLADLAATQRVLDRPWCQVLTEGVACR